MKKFLALAMFAILFAACGNKVANTDEAVAVDSVEVAVDSIAVDSVEVEAVVADSVVAE